MLEDSFVESLVVRKNGINGVIFNVTAVVGAIVLIIFVNLVPFMFWGPDVFYVTVTTSIIILFGLYNLLKLQHREYEFEMSNDFFDCALIKGRNKREELVSFSLKECEYIGPVTSDRFEADKRNANFVIKLTDLADFPIDDKYWYFFLTHEGIKFVVIFIYKEEMYPVFRRYNPRATKPMIMPAKKKSEENTDGSAE